MASKGKGKDKIKLKKDEIRFKDKLVDAKRVAYDVVKYTTVKFGLPEDCISVWEGSDNDYGCDDFCSVVSREIIGYQIVVRYHYFESFDKRHKLNRLKSFDLIGKLLQDVMYEEMAGRISDILNEVEMSLSVLGELVLYLYTKDIDLNLKQLIDHWFDCHLNMKKKSFEGAGGLTELYDRNKKPKFDRYEYFHDLFIKNYCLPYKDTASNPDIMVKYYQSYTSRLKKDAESLFPNVSEDVKKEILRRGLALMSQHDPKDSKLAPEIAIAEEAVFGPPKPDETAQIDSNDETGVKLPENTLLGIPGHHELYGIEGPLGAVERPCQDLPEANPEELQYNRLSVKEKIQLKRASFLPGLDQDLGILEHHELYAVGGPWGALVTLSQDVPEAHPEELQCGKRLYQRVAQDLPQANPSNGTRPSTGDKMQTIKAGVHPSLEESLGQLSLDLSKPKVSMKKRAT